MGKRSHRKRERGFRPSEHHIFPKARFPQFKNCKWNIAHITQREHDAFNILFGGCVTPQEAFEILLNRFCNGIIDYQEATN